jgi:hypothetical protein
MLKLFVPPAVMELFIKDMTDNPEVWQLVWQSTASKFQKYASNQFNATLVNVPNSLPLKLGCYLEFDDEMSMVEFKLKYL